MSDFDRCSVEADNASLSRYHPLFAWELLDCLAKNREPTEHELDLMAARIKRETNIDGPFDAGTRLIGNGQNDLARAARLALCGDDRVLPEKPSSRPSRRRRGPVTRRDG